jgi:hypothetical protein
MKRARAPKSALPARLSMAMNRRGSRKKMKNALLVLNSTLPDLTGAFGRKGEVVPVAAAAADRHRLGPGGQPSARREGSATSSIGLTSSERR